MNTMGFYKAYVTGKVYTFEHENRGRKKILPLLTFPVSKSYPLTSCSPAELVSVSLYEYKSVNIF